MLVPWDVFPAQQQPTYSNSIEFGQVRETVQIIQLKTLPKIVDHYEITYLKDLLVHCHHSNCFVLHIGDCAEPFEDCTRRTVNKKIRAYEDYRRTLRELIHKPVILIGRIAGQFAKPRTEEVEFLNGRNSYLDRYHTYKGDLINSFCLSGREPDPQRMLQGHSHATAVAGFIRDKYCFTEDFLFFSHEALLLPYEADLSRETAGELFNTSAHMV